MVAGLEKQPETETRKVAECETLVGDSVKVEVQVSETPWEIQIQAPC